jgi:hypothetical protein
VTVSVQSGRTLRLLRGGNGSFAYTGNVSLTFGAHGFERIFSREFISNSSLPLGRSLQERRDFFCTKAVCHESVIMLRCLLFGRTSLRNAMFQQKAKHRV